MKGLLRLLALMVGMFLLCSSLSAQGNATHERLAQEFLDALVFHDLQGMWERLDPETQSSNTPQALMTAIEAMPIVAGEAEIVAIQPTETGATVRYRLHGVHPTSGTPVTLPGTLQIVASSDGPRVRFRPPTAGQGAQASQPATVGNAAPAVMLPESQVINGLTAQDVMSRMTAAHGNFHSLRMGVQINANMMGQGTNLSGQFLYMAPNRIRLDLGEVLFISDGFSAHLYLSAANAHMTIPPTLLAGISGLAPGFGTVTSNIQASLLGEEEVNGVQTYHLAVLDQGAGATAANLLGGMTGPIHLWVDTEHFFPVRTQVAAMGMQMAMTFHSVEANPTDILPEAFIFQPPPGSMEIPMMLPF